MCSIYLFSFFVVFLHVSIFFFSARSCFIINILSFNSRDNNSQHNNNNSNDEEKTESRPSQIRRGNNRLFRPQVPAVPRLPWPQHQAPQRGAHGLRKVQGLVRHDRRNYSGHGRTGKRPMGSHRRMATNEIRWKIFGYLKRRKMFYFCFKKLKEKI